MFASGIVYALPLWALYIVTAAIVLLSTEAGWRLGNYRRHRDRRERNAPVGAGVSATLGLLAFLLAFTFGMAATRFDTRKQLVLQEANVIGTAYLRAYLLPEPQRSRSHNSLREYAELRVGNAASNTTSEAVAKASALQDRLWTDAVAVAAQNPDSFASELFVQSLNEVFDVDAARVAASRNRIPGTIWQALYFATILSMCAMGYQFGLTGEHSWTVSLLLVFVFSAVLLLIADLDRPQEGLIKISQEAMTDLIERIGAAPP